MFFLIFYLGFWNDKKYYAIIKIIFFFTLIIKIFYKIIAKLEYHKPFIKKIKN